MSGDFIQAAIIAALREITRQFPGLAPAAILAQLQNWLEDTGAFLAAWQKLMGFLYLLKSIVLLHDLLVLNY